MRRFLTMLVLLMSSCILTFAQNRLISGKVTDDNGTPVSGASVKVKGARTGVAADANGLFSISVPANSIIVVSGVGLTQREVAVGNQSTINVSLVRSGTELEAVTIVTALGIRRKPEEVGYSTAKLDTNQITAGHSFNLAQALSGKVSGLTISNTSASVNASPRIVLRGLRSITGDNTALIVLDGVPVPANTMNYINPNDVERIDVLKGGQAATLFGSDGVNGAIVITTKKGSKTPSVTFSHSSNVEKLSYLPRFQKTYGSGSAYGANPAENFHASENQQFGPRYDGSLRGLGRTTSVGTQQVLPYSYIENNRESVWNTGYTAQSDVSYKSGDQISNFYASYQNLHSAGIVPGDIYNRNSLRMNAGRAYGKFKVSFDATYTFDNAIRTNSDYYFFSVNQPGWAPFNNYRDWKNDPFADPSGYYNDYYNNPFWQKDNNRFNTKNNYFNGNVSANFKASQNLDFTLRLAAATTNTFQTVSSDFYAYNAWSKTGAYSNNFNLNYDVYLTGRGRYIAKNTPLNGSFSDNTSNGSRLNGDLFASYNKNFSDVSLKAIVGTSLLSRASTAVSTGISSIAIPGLFNVNNSQNGILTGSDSRSLIRKIGSYGDVTLGLKSMFYVHGVFRYDMSSVFYATNRPKDLYSFAYYGGDVSLILTDLIPAIKNDFINYAKLRAGWNKNGNDNLSPYNLTPTFSSASGFPYSGLLGTTVSNTAINPNLKPENTTTTEVGVELSLWNNRIGLEATYYTQDANDQILNVSISSTTGFSSYLLNAANVKNQGYELDGRINIFKQRDWNINLNANYTYITNEVKELFANNGLNTLLFQDNGTATLNAEVGKMFPYLKTTAYQRDAAGHIIIDPLNGSPMKASATVGIGNTLPKHQVGVGMNVAYKGLTFMANAEYRGGFVVYHDLSEDLAFTGSGALSTLFDRQQFVWPNSVYDDGTGKYVTNTNIAFDNYHSIYYGLGDLGNSASLQNVGENHYSSGAFWKLRDISLGYQVPASVLKSINVIKGINISVWGRNLKTWLAEDNYITDPEFSNTSGNSQGINNTLNTPPTKQYGATIKVTL